MRPRCHDQKNAFANLPVASSIVIDTNQWLCLAMWPNSGPCHAMWTNSGLSTLIAYAVCVEHGACEGWFTHPRTTTSTAPEGSVCLHQMIFLPVFTIQTYHSDFGGRTVGNRYSRGGNKLGTCTIILKQTLMS
jgi:hypothetical protein